MIIYAITGPNNKKYIGQTTQELSKRWKKHLRCAAKNSHYYIHKAIRKHGVSSFSIEALVIVHTKKDLDFYESFLISELKTNDKKFGYNIAPGGRGGDSPACHTPEATEKLRKALRAIPSEKHPSFRKDISTELIIKEYQVLKSTYKVAKKLNIGVNLVYNRLKKLNLTIPRKKVYG